MVYCGFYSVCSGFLGNFVSCGFGCRLAVFLVYELGLVVFGFGLWVSDFGGFRLRVLFWCCGVVDCLMVPSLGGGFGVGFPFGTLWLA